MHFFHFRKTEYKEVYEFGQLDTNYKLPIQNHFTDKESCIEQLSYLISNELRLPHIWYWCVLYNQNNAIFWHHIDHNYLLILATNPSIRINPYTIYLIHTKKLKSCSHKPASLKIEQPCFNLLPKEIQNLFLNGEL
jgi:hypothetical protein